MHLTSCFLHFSIFTFLLDSCFGWASNQILGKIWPSGTMQSEYPVIQNLGRFASSLETKHCLIFLDNFSRIHLPNITTPFITRTLTLLFIYQDDFDLDVKVYGPKTLATQNLTVPPTEISECPLSKYFTSLVDSYGDASICFRLNLVQFWKRVKLWNCLVHFALYPSDFYYSEYQEQKWNNMYEGRISVYPYKFPTIKSNSINIFVHNSYISSLSFFKLFDPRKFGFAQLDYHGEIFIIGEIIKLKIKRLELLGPSCRIHKLLRIIP